MVQRVGQSPYLSDVSNPVASEVYDLERQKRIADLLTQKGMETPQGQIVGGRFVKPSWSQYANQMLSAYLGGAESRDVARQQQDLANKLRMQGAQETQGIIQALSGRPAQQQVLGTEVSESMLPQGQTAISDEGTPTLVQPALEAVKPNAGLALARALSAQTPQAQMIGQELLKQALTPQKLTEGESLVLRDLFGTGGYTPIATGGEKKPTEYKEYEKAVEGGFKGSFFDYQRALKQAGAQPINVSMGKDFAGQVGDIVRESAGMARAAQQTVQSADKIINAADKAITGKGAEVRLTATQLADTLGVGGKDKEKLEKTRELVQETAKLAINAANNKGQGAVSDYERSLYNRAAGGDINLTPTELKLIANRAKEGASYAIQSHQAKINAMKSNPETAQLVPYFDVIAPQQTPVAPTGGLPSQSAIDAEIARRQGRR